MPNAYNDHMLNVGTRFVDTAATRQPTTNRGNGDALALAVKVPSRGC